MDPINYNDVKSKVSSTAREMGEDIKTAINGVNNSATVQGLKQDLKALETDVIAPAFDTISKKTAEVVTELQPIIKSTLKEMGGDVKSLLKRIKF